MNVKNSNLEAHKFGVLQAQLGATPDFRAVAALPWIRVFNCQINVSRLYSGNTLNAQQLQASTKQAAAAMFLISQHLQTK